MDSSSFPPSGTPPPPGAPPPGEQPPPAARPPHGVPPSATPPPAPASPPPESAFPPGAAPPPGPPPGTGEAPTAPYQPQAAPPSPAGGAWEQIEQVLGTAERAATQIRAEAESQAQREFQEAQRMIEAMTRERVAMVSELTDALIEHATLVATQCEGLVRRLEATMQRLGGPPPQAAPEPPSEFGSDPAQAARSLGAWPEQPAGPQSGSVSPQQQAAGQSPTASPTSPEQPAPPPPPRWGPQAPGAYPAATPPSSSGPGVAPAAGAAPDEAYVMATRLALEGRDRAAIGAQLRAEFGIRDPEPVLDSVLGRP
jgi:hypothetical protein